ncbi:HTH-type transcriptional activator IlvY [Pseudoalteromonas tunicata]|uniref:HTH-type transcriptional activator IlvY n=1 Tax=Pseudoalteromonas tunicata TaxID=314281 RepID=UPI00058EACE8|nr:HTH-type transcriptional activator IlvY [Pseudoalteromonas tunicata]AXT32577.1 HTH-type transcriptional activator IlvY [Pseudoalteromonas tunicata]MDP4982797.1 HTH-type transcriptional activator IlvY [Pseudoalteromonas tunicata]MDP5213732.1 HTH-type transcriptional activator IlvY [Pseudoalteromonas tunicata]
MDQRSLHVFLALADTLHFGRASERCHVSAPTLSRNIKQLEDTLGVSLFLRDNRTVRLTQHGLAFIEYAHTSLQQWQKLKLSFEQSSEQLVGEISLFCSVTASYSFLYKLLEQFRLQYQQVEIKLHTGDPALALDRIIEQHEDMAIAARPDQLAANLAFCSIGYSSLQFIAPIGHGDIATYLADCANNNKEIQWHTLPFIVPELGLNRKRLESWWKKMQIKPPIYAQVAGNEAIVSMVSLGFGVALVPQIVLDNSPLLDKVQILSAPFQPEAFEIGLCVLRNRLQDPLIKAMYQTAQALAL